MSYPAAHNRRTGRSDNASSALNTPSGGADAIRASYAISATPRLGALGERSAELLDACRNNDLALFLAHMRRPHHAARSAHDGFSPLIGACSYDAHRIVQWLCRNDRAALERKDSRGNTPLHHAAAAGAVRSIAAMRDARVRLDVRNSEGATALHFAAYHGHRETAALLVAAARSLLDAHDTTGKTPLMLAAFRGRTQAASLLLARGASVNVQDRAGWSALMYAAFAGRIAICRELLDYAANPALKDRASARCASDWARRAGYYEVADMLQNRVVSLRTPSLPEGVDMPYLHLPTPVPASSRPISQAPSLLRPAIERALSPTRRRSHVRPLPPPTIPQSPASTAIRGSFNKMPSRQQTPKGLNIAMSGRTAEPSSKQSVVSKKASPVPSVPAASRKQQSQKSTLSPKQRNVEPMDPMPLKKKKSPNPDHARSAPPPPPPPPQQKPRKLAAKKAHAGADPKAPRRVQQKAGRLVRVKRQVAQIPEAPPPPLESTSQKVVSPQKTPQPQKPTSPQKPTPLHTPITVVTEVQHEAADLQKVPSLSSRIRDTVSRASLRYLDSRTPPELRSSASASRDLEAAQAAGRQRRRLPTLASPRRHSINSAWMGPCWRVFARIVTLWMPSFVLRKLLHKETPGKRQAWREKLALCLIILLVTAVTALISFGLSVMLCHPVEPVSPEALLSDHGANSTQPLVAVRGRIYDLSDPMTGASLHLSDADYGRDAATLLPPFPEEAAACKRWPEGSLAHICNTPRTQDPRCVPYAKAWNTLRRHSTHKWVVHPWRDVLRPDNPDGLFAYNGFVYSLEPYFSSGGAYYGTDADALLALLVGNDATIAVSRSRTLQALVPCWNAQLRVGRVEGGTPGCVITSGITIAATVVLNAMILIKLLCAVLFDWAFSLQLRKITKHFTRAAVSGRRVPHVLVAVTCCNETEATLRSTFDAIALSNYACSRKLLFIVADGDVAAAADAEADANAAPTTPQILRAMVRPSEIAAPRALPYMAVGEGPREFNAAEVVSGSYTSTNGIVVPCILVVKVGT
ncbi:ATP-dependent RNA helicase, partial [Coemansia guatemalensis]